MPAFCAWASSAATKRGGRRAGTTTAAPCSFGGLPIRLGSDFLDIPYTISVDASYLTYTISEPRGSCELPQGSNRNPGDRSPDRGCLTNYHESVHLGAAPGAGRTRRATITRIASPTTRAEARARWSPLNAGPATGPPGTPIISRSGCCRSIALAIEVADDAQHHQGSGRAPLSTQGRLVCDGQGAR